MKRSLAILFLLTIAVSGCGVQGGATAAVKKTSNVVTVNSCTDDSGTHANNSSWACPDGCNTCHCKSGNILSTLMSCGPG